LPGSGESVKLFDYPVSVVETDTAVIFCLDPDLRITYCNPAWDRFALENGGAEMCRPAPIGRPILDSIGGSDREYFETHYRRVLQQSEPWERDYECSSPSVYRKFRLRVVPMQSIPGLFVMNSLQVETAHQLEECAPLEEAYRTSFDLIVMCASCRRTRRNAGGGAEIWDWVPKFVERIPARTSHGVCAHCNELYYPA
jgi:hypothetical protein